MPITAQNIIKDALLEVGVISPADGLDADVANFALGKLNRLLDNWNAERAAVFANQIKTYALTPGLQPHTIGPSGSFIEAQRPVSIEAANLVYSTGTRVPLNMRHPQWWRTLTLPLLKGPPSDLYYEPSWPDGAIYLWPVPTTAYDLELFIRVVLSGLDLSSAFSLPPGYQDAITLTLAEDIVGPLRAEPSGLLVQKAREARARIFNNNDHPPRIATADYGFGVRRGTFDYLTGRNR